MSAPAGWYPDTANAHITRYWNGIQWTQELRWDGTRWVDPYAAPPPPVATAPVVAVPITPTPVDPTPTPVVNAPVDTSPFSAPPVAIPPVETSPFAAAPVATPPVETSPFAAPPIATPPLDTSPFTAPPVETSPFSPPPVAVPPVATPAVDPAPFATPPAAAANPFTRPPATPPPAAPMPPTMYPAPAVGAKRPSPTPSFLIFAIGSAGVLLSAFMPWVSVSGFGVSISSEPGTGGPAVLVVFAAAILAIVWPTISSPVLSKARRIGLLPIVGFLALAVVTNWSDLVDLQDKYDGTGFAGVSVDPGAGFYLYTVCVIALVVGVVRVWLAGNKSPTAG